MKQMSAPILDRLSKARVFDLAWDAETERFEVREACDQYFSVLLTPDELVALSRELLRAAVTKGDE